MKSERAHRRQGSRLLTEEYTCEDVNQAWCFGKEELADSMLEGKYTKINITKAWLMQNGFWHSRKSHIEELDVYTYRFPVYKYGKLTVLEGEISVLIEDGSIDINVYRYGTCDKYAPYYSLEYGNYEKILHTIHERIDRELKRLGINHFCMAELLSDKN